MWRQLYVSAKAHPNTDSLTAKLAYTALCFNYELSSGCYETGKADGYIRQASHPLAHRYGTFELNFGPLDKFVQRGTKITKPGQRFLSVPHQTWEFSFGNPSFSLYG